MGNLDIFLKEDHLERERGRGRIKKTRAGMGDYDPIMLHTCIKYHNESRYFIQLIYTNILDVGYCFIIGSIQELEEAEKLVTVHSGNTI